MFYNDKAPPRTAPLGSAFAVRSAPSASHTLQGSGGFSTALCALQNCSCLNKSSTHIKWSYCAVLPLPRLYALQSARSRLTARQPHKTHFMCNFALWGSLCLAPLGNRLNRFRSRSHFVRSCETSFGSNKKTILDGGFSRRL